MKDLEDDLVIVVLVLIGLIVGSLGVAVLVVRLTERATGQ
jgi:hypothetical protein